MKDKGNESALRFPLLKFILSVCLWKSFCSGHVNSPTRVVERRGEPSAKPQAGRVCECRRCQKGCTKQSAGSAHLCFFRDAKIVLRVDLEDPVHQKRQLLFLKSVLTSRTELPVADTASLTCLFPPSVPRSRSVQQASAPVHPTQAEPLSARGGAHQAAAALHGLLPAAAVQGLHAGAGYRQPGAGEAAPRLAGSHHRAAPEGTGEGVPAPCSAAGQEWAHSLAVAFRFIAC